MMSATAEMFRQLSCQQSQALLETSVRRKMAPMYMQDKYHKARGVIYSIGLAVLVVLLAWKFIVR